MNEEVPNRVSVTINPTFWDVFIASLEVIRFQRAMIVAHAVFPVAGLFILVFPLWRGIPLTLGEIIIAVFALSFTPIITAFSVWMLRRGNQLAQGPFTYTFDAEGMHTSAAKFSQMIQWSAVPRVRRSKRFLFVFVSSTRALCIPLRAVSDEKFLDQLRSVAGQQTDFR